MSMSTHIMGFRPADARWQKMKEAYEACESAGVGIPKAVSDFFGKGSPYDPGVEVELGEAISEYNGDGVSGFEVDVTKLPDGVTVVRFYNGW